MMEHIDLAIIGAGWHGLAMAKTYSELHPDAKICILDQAMSIGGTWANERLYPGLKTNNIVGSYEFSDFPLIPKQYGIEPGQHIPGQVVYRYLCDFCDVFGLTPLIRLRRKVESVTLLPNGSWNIFFMTMQAGESSDTGQEVGQSGELVASKLVLATGLTSEPFIPHLPGRESFKGHVFHAKYFKHRAQKLTNVETVVVIGGNKSAWDVCYGASSRFGSNVHMVMRRSGGGPSWCWPAKMEGFIKSISTASATRLFTWLDPNPYGPSAWPVRALIQRTWLGQKLSDLFWSYLDNKITQHNAYENSPGTAALRPWSSTFWMGNSLSIHNYETSWFDLAQNGQITAHAAEVTKLTDDSVHLSDGSVIKADAVICCTGWKTRPNIEFLPEGLEDRLGFPGTGFSDQKLEAKARADILREAPVLRAQPIRQIPATLGTEHTKLRVEKSDLASPYRHYRFMLPCDPDIIRMKNLCVIGAQLTLHTSILAQAQALWITAFFDNRIPQLVTNSQNSPNIEGIQRETFHATEFQRMRRPKETGGAGDRCPDLVFDSIPRYCPGQNCAPYPSPEVRAVTVDGQGLIVDVSTDPEQDDTWFIGYLPLSTTESLHDCRTVNYSKLQELDQLGPGVDLSAYADENGNPHKVAFKFNPIAKPRRLHMAWDELHLLKSLPPHENIVPFDRVVLEDVERRVIGFTTKYIPGGTLDGLKVPFRFEWLQQLTNVVDFLNLDLGIMHQGVAPRNLLIDPDTQRLLLFDFDWVNIAEWPCNRPLDSDVSTMRNLNEWVKKRKSSDDMQRYLNAPNRLTWQDLPTPPNDSVPYELGITADGETNWVTGLRLRRTATEKGQYVFSWERPPQSRLKKCQSINKD
ncbi:hypothetical protein F53441_7072 [Fusarium austroafricanum]|uniref:Protein kinase domain-containing protein n=1 Tax=Fusarium austroafricanum TaxID=2364996 RepID=A0A8H4P6A1_9HYPO|nr:hypothetical protein F53441_7072 [Fusarium austroafricanum]